MKREEKKGLPFFGIPKLAPYLKPYRMLFFWMVTMGGIGSAMDAVIPLFQQHAIDHFIAEKTMDGIGGFLALYILVMLVQTATNYISAYGACKVELYIGRDLKREAFNHLQTLSFSYFNQNSVGYIHARVMSDTDRIASTLAWGLMEGVWYIAYLLFAVVMMFVLNWHLALCVMVIVPVLVVSGAYFQKKLVFFHRRVREQNSRITGAFNEGITGAKTTKTLVIEDKVEREFDGLTGEMKRMSVRAMHFRSVFMSTTAFAASVALAIVLAGAAALVYGIISWRGGSDFGVYFALFGFAAVFFFSGAHVLPTAKNNRRAVERAWDEAQAAVANVLPEDFPLPARYAHPIVLDRMIRILREGRAQSKEEALEVLKADLRALTADVQVEQEEHDEVVVIKPLFLVSDYQ